MFRLEKRYRCYKSSALDSYPKPNTALVHFYVLSAVSMPCGSTLNNPLPESKRQLNDIFRHSALAVAS
jgi:hypothetical protein